MPKFIWIGPIIVSVVVLSFGVNIAEPETSDTLQVLKRETAHSVRVLSGSIRTTYEDFELSSCILTFRTRTFLREITQQAQTYKNKYVLDKALTPQTSKYAFALQNMDVRLEWLTTYNSYVLSLSGLGSLTAEESPGDLMFGTRVKSSNPPNISIPFENENSAKRAKIALQDAIDGCRGKKDPVQKLNVTASSVREELLAGVNDDKYAIKVNVDLVTADVTVIGDEVPELKAEDFVIYDDKIAQQISYFSHDLPISVAIVLDPWFGMPEMNIAALSALRLLKPGDQEALYFLNGDRVGNLTEDRLYTAELIRLLANYPQQYVTWNMFGTLYDAARYLKQEASGRRAVILISRNIQLGTPTFGLPDRDSLGKNDMDTVIERTKIELLESATTLYAVTPSYDIKKWYGPKVKSVAEDTGGEMITVIGPEKRSAAPISGLRQAIDRLRTQYTLGFTPPNQGERGRFHELTVKLANEDRCPKCRIKVRKGYYAGVAAPPLPVQKPQAKSLQSVSEIDNKLIQKIIFVAGTSYYDLDDISFAIRNAEKVISPSGQNQMMIDLSIDPAGIDTVASEGRRTYRMQAAMFYSDKNRNLLGSNIWKIEGSLGEEDFNSVRRKGIPFSAMIPVMAEDQILRIVLYDEIGGRVASKFTRKKGKGLAIVKQDNSTVWHNLSDPALR